jgi:hypothetical protein
MIFKQQLRFLDASPDAFLKEIKLLAKAKSCLLIGQNPLAKMVAKNALDAGIKLAAKASLPAAAGLNKFQIIIFTDQDEALLASQLLSCLDLKNVAVIAPITERHFSKKPLFIVSIPKGGTHLLYELANALGYDAGIELPDFPNPKTWYCVEYSNSHTVARDFFVDTVRRSPFGNRHHPILQSPVLFGYRHPLDILVSEAHYYSREGKTAFAGYFNEATFEERLNILANDEWLLGSLRERIGGFLPWLQFPNVIPASFEELVGKEGGGSIEAQRRLIWSIMLKLQVDGAVSDVASKVFNKQSATFRDGAIGAYKAQLSKDLQIKLRNECQDVIEGFGYSPQLRSIMPLNPGVFQGRPLKYVRENFDNMPITVEPDFIGFNLVRYARKFYAVPITVGNFSIEKATPEIIARIPSSDSLSNLKMLLQIGGDSFKVARAQTDKLAKWIIDKRDIAETYYWGNNEQLTLLDPFEGFNIIRDTSLFIAVRQSLGFVDFSVGLTEVLSQYGLMDIFVSESLAGLKNHINKFSQSTRLIACIEDLKKELEATDIRLKAENSQTKEMVEDKALTLSSNLQKLDEALNNLSWKFEQTLALAQAQQAENLESLKKELGISMNMLAKNLEASIEKLISEYEVNNKRTEARLSASSQSLSILAESIERSPIFRFSNWIKKILRLK